ncbi:MULTISPECIES: sugar transferase [Paenibacillus]|uniref:Lipopolysaccharide/colanic/teichoic acid biosynthesis glycosyltransferase n=1 Tax=Paenibacillus pabuli TaxID=1472 RepID=A0A855Y1N0_9BACL|nr:MULTISPECIES: sugar transferase [Paenibacillus]PWW45216.1 lipopolysaccharide/colanic/teichoic acid biosynthesis glycosyltransferase [Paenibacillus pabuli]PXW11553.1 lipopolysaccharide/colanic/teichoic acid biosynthesis glycosyltransferase [Paenibacillus taichungensis]
MKLSGPEYFGSGEAIAKEGTTVVLEQPYSQRVGGYTEVMKPFIDFVIAAVLLLITSPVMLVAAIMIKLDSKGSVIFRQERYGKNGVKFNIYKFRTMRTDAPKYSASPTTSNDPRITRLGRLLRKTSLDELPQLLNIIKGDMSFVGPRPEQKRIVEECYTDLERRRFLVKPGITGLWQVSDVRKDPIHHNLQYDFHYISNVSILMDIKILFKTVIVMIKSNTF